MIPQRYARLLLMLAATLSPVALEAAPPNSSRSASAPAPAPVRVEAAGPIQGRVNGLFGPVPERAAPAPRPAIAPASRSGDSAFGAMGRAMPTSSIHPLYTPPSILYAPSVADDPAYRAAIAAITGGTVDYFDARAGTPTAVQLAAYTCVYTWADFPYADRVLFGDRLADYVDAGGKVILGSFCTFTDGNSLGGRIMTPAYCPVTSPGGDNHYAFSPYAGDGTKSLHAGVLAYGCDWRDILVTQGAGIVNGTYADGEIAHAYRPDGRVIYSNGGGAIPIAGTSGDWPKLIANIAMANPSARALLCAPTDADDSGFRITVSTATSGVVDYFNSTAATPSAALLNTYDCIASWVNFTPADPVLLGDRLADRVDGGGRVILGPFSTFNSSPWYISGRIMTPDYDPATSPNGDDHYTSGTSAGDGVTGLFTGVASVEAMFRDFLIGQGNGIVDGHYGDGEILAAYRPDGRVIHLNGTSHNLYGTGDWPVAYANAVNVTFPAGHRMLFAPSSIDFPDYRAAIAAQTGGTVDYFDASAGTPTLAQMLAYDCVYTLLNVNYADRVLMGDRLADYVDAGGKVILGVFTTYTQSPITGLGGRIMTPAYNPVTSLNGKNHYFSSAYFANGTTSFHRNIAAYQTAYRDSLTLQGSGKRDGSYADGEIGIAYRPDRRVVYVNGIGSAYGTGDWARLVANACDVRINSGVLYGCNDAGQMFVLNPLTGAGSFAYNLPTLGSTGATEIVSSGTTGDAWVQGRDFTNGIQKFRAGDGLPLAGVVADGASFNGLEFALGRLYGTSINGLCGSSNLMTLNPTTGVALPVGSTSLGPIAGLAFDPRASVLYGITSNCAGLSNLVRFEITGGTATVLGTAFTTFSSLEFGPDGDLYAGGDFLDGGYLANISTMNSLANHVGYSGYGGITGLMLAPPGTVAVDDASPRGLSFSTPFPNPSVKGELQFRFSLPAAGDARLELYDVAGRLRWQKSMPGSGAGDHVVSWDGRASTGERLGAGVYQMRLVSPVGSRAVRVVRLD